MQQESTRQVKRSKQVDRQVLLNDVGPAQVVVDRDAGIVDEDVEMLDIARRPPNLRCVGYVQCQWRHTWVDVWQRAARSGIYPACSPFKCLVEQRSTDPAVGSGDQDYLVFD